MYIYTNIHIYRNIYDICMYTYRYMYICTYIHIDIYAFIKVIIATLKTHAKSKYWGGKGLFVLRLHIVVHTEELRRRNSKWTGIWRQGLMQTPWRGSAYCLAHNGLFSLPLYSTQDNQPKEGTIHNGLDPPHKSLTKKMIYRLLYRQILMRHFLEVSFSQMTLACVKLT